MRVLVPNVASVDKLNDFRDGGRVGIYTNIIFVNHVRRVEEWKPYRTGHGHQVKCRSLAGRYSGMVGCFWANLEPN